jgi:hypothetical protein
MVFRFRSPRARPLGGETRKARPLRGGPTTAGPPGFAEVQPGCSTIALFDY